MQSAGIDTSYFKPYSMHSATTSKASQTTGSLLEVLKMGNWKNTSTFFKFYLCKVKYFKCDENTHNQLTQVPIDNVPTSPLQVRAHFSLEKAKRKLRNVVGKVPHVELPPEQQGYETDRDSYTDRDSNFLDTPASTIPPSPVSTIESDHMDNVYHPIVEISPVLDNPPATENSATSVIKLKQGTLTITKPSPAVNAQNMGIKAVQQKKSSKKVNKPKLGQPPNKDMSR